ncbi:MAG TPA: 50S ribosomal protein L6 [Bacillota bacterium]|nr:50S ribosomal protein L6 [Bacillota bacterium]
MKKELYQIIEIPEGISAEIIENVLKISGAEGEIEKKFNTNNLEFNKKGNEIIIGNKKATKKEKKLMNTIAAHIKNMIEGVQKKFEYQLKICFSHFPINVEIKEGEAIIKNFLGEKIPRRAKIPKGVEIEMDKEIIKVISPNKELAGQAAANFETATKIRKKDRRVFQDGIFIINKAGKEI